jgi:large conductance mechanosensitive channel
MKKFFGEFKKFITRGNVLDMSVGVIVGGAFTAIVNGMSNFILKPIVNWILAVCLGKNALSEMFTFLVRATKLDETGAEVVDLANSIYIDWGSFINAVINFLLTAIVLFCIVKIINGVKEKDKKFKESMQPVISKEDRIEMKKRGIKSKDTAAIKAYFDEKAAKEEAEKAAAAEKARLDREANPTTEDLLKKILAVLEKN